ncbi:MAG: histidine kinase N-terminal 7TM domain-containing protein [Candidatus Hodarchaeales archaeon]
MPYEFSVFALVMGAISVLALFIATYPLIYRKRSRLMYHFTAMIGSAAVWCIGYAFEIAAIDKPTVWFWTIFQYIGIVTLPPLFLLFVLVFTNHEVSTRPLTGLLFFPSFVHWLLLLTNESHGLFYESVELNTSAPFITLDRIYGPTFYSHTIYSYILLSVGFILLLRTFLQVRASKINVLFQKQLLIMMLGMISPTTGNIIRVFNLIPPLEFIDLTPIFFLIGYILFAYALFEVGFLDLIPFAYRVIIRNLADIGLVATNEDNKILDMNSQACWYILGKECEDIVGRDLFSLLYAQEGLKSYHDRIHRVERSLYEIQENQSFEMELFNQEESHLEHYRIDVVALRDKGRIMGFIYVIRRNFQKQIEILLRKSNDFKASLLGVISHDLKNQVMVIQGFTDVIRKELENPNYNFTEIEEFLDGINVKSREIQHIITDVRTYLKEMGTFDEEKEVINIDIRKVLNSVILSLEPTTKKKQLEIKSILPEESELVTLADLRLNSVFYNLLDNAIKWSPPNDVIEVSIAKENGYWVCSISDHGSGVPDELKQEIFKPFFGFGTEKGSGLGLSIATEIIKSYFCDIWIEDVQPQGANFKFTLPIAEAKNNPT